MSRYRLWKSVAGATGKSFLFFVLWVATMVALSLHYDLSLPATWQLGFSSLDSVGALLVALLMWRFVDRRPVRELFARCGRAGRCAGMAALLALALSLCSILLMLAPDAFRVVGVTDRPAMAALALLVLAPAAFFEEMAFRGYLLPVWQRAVGTHWAVAVTALLFALLHGPGTDLTWVSCLNVYLAGILLAFIRLRCDIWAATAFHFVWNAVQTVMGFNLSGNDIPGLLVLTSEEHGWISGGGYGIEGSVCTLIMLALAVSWLSLRPRRDCTILP